MSTKTQADIDYAKRKKTPPSISLTHAGYNVRVVLDRKGIAYPIWGSHTSGLIAQMRAFIGAAKFKEPARKLPSAKVRESFEDTLEKTALKMGAKGWARV